MLRNLKVKFPIHAHPELIVGLNTADDAAVFKINDKQALIQTIDFFAPVVDDPYQYGAISAANALSDIYAMGGDVLFALNVAAFPDDLPLSVITAILDGGAEKVREAGGAIAGGHTIVDKEPKYGLSVSGIAHPDLIRTNGRARPGDAIILTKALGTGSVLSAIQDGKISSEHEKALIEQMMSLNRVASEIMRDFDIHAVTDVTGFGLAGHLLEVSESSGVQIELFVEALPAVMGARESVSLGYSTIGQRRNRDYFSRLVQEKKSLSAFEEMLIYDPQTSGGLLITLEESSADVFESRLSDGGVLSWRIGSVDVGSGIRLSH